MTTNQPPQSITTDAGKALWRDVLAAYELESHHLRLLEQACLQLDRAEGFRTEVVAHGVCVKDRFDQLKTNPAVDGERQAHLALARLLRELALDFDSPAEQAGDRLPRIAKTGT